MVFMSAAVHQTSGNVVLMCNKQPTSIINLAKLGSAISALLLSYIGQIGKQMKRDKADSKKETQIKIRGEGKEVIYIAYSLTLVKKCLSKYGGTLYTTKSLSMTHRPGKISWIIL